MISIGVVIIFIQINQHHRNIMACFAWISVNHFIRAFFISLGYTVELKEINNCGITGRITYIMHIKYIYVYYIGNLNCQIITFFYPSCPALLFGPYCYPTVKIVFNDVNNLS